MAKHKRKNRVRTIRIGETPTPERRHHNGGVVSEAVDRGANDQILILRYKAIAECPLDIYYVKNRISEAEYKTALRFRHAYFRGVLDLKVGGIGGGDQGAVGLGPLAVIYSRELLDQAYKALSASQKAAVISVCGHDEWAGTTAKVKTLCRALQELAKLWGFV